jgi:signal transduction histidine kinase
MTQPASIVVLDSPPSSDARDVRDQRGEIARLSAELARERALRLDAERARADLEARAAATSAARDDFLGAAAHDLRTPLAALKLQVQGLLRRTTEPLEVETVATRLRAMDRQLVHMSELLDRLFEIGRSDDPLDLAPERIDLVELVRDVAGRYADDLAWARCPLTLTLPEAPVIGSWDRLRIDQVLTNLLTNAKKYGRGAPIAIELTATAEKAILKVSDHGIGIAPDQLDAVFDKYVRTSGRRTITGLGLGLWIVRRIVDRCRGSIDVESQLGVGSTFTLVLPRSSLDGP